MSEQRFDAVVIGAGPGSYPAAIPAVVFTDPEIAAIGINR
jgi:pyruvate/2-oxoglutarate dehydrogenase complex dihydrolipoamide dehydrogenase (E3) component